MKEKNKKNKLIILIIIFISILFSTKVYGTDVDWSTPENRKKYNIVDVKKSQFKVITTHQFPSDFKDVSIQGFCMTERHYVFAMLKDGGECCYIYFLDINNPSKVIKRANLGKVGHMNDMTYNPKTGQIFATGDGDKKWIVIEDKTMTIKSKNCVTPASAIAYNIEKNQYAMKWGDQLIITDSNFKAKSRKSVFPPVQKKAPFLITQGMGTDGKYIYHVQFEVGYASVLQNKIWNSKQRNSNLLTVYDYNGNCIKNILISKDVFAGEMESMCVDADGNMFVIYKKSNNKEVTIAKIDMAVPTLTVSYSTTNKTNGNVKATIKANEVVQSVSGWTLSSDKKSLTKTYTSNVSSQKVTVKDTAGNTSTATIKISNIDKTAPTLNVSYSTTNKTNGNVKATIKANEVVQQVSGWTLSSDKKSLTKTYTSNVSNQKVTVKDTAGNTKTATINISNIDKTAPKLTVSYSTTNKTNGSVTATITANEVVQAVSGWTLSADKKSLNKKYTSNVSNEKVTVKDTAGNAKTETINISNIDKVVPTITVSYSTTEATNGNVTATITSNKEIQAVSGWKLSADKKSLTKTYTSNVNNEKVIVKDIAGNASTATINISNIDKTAPKVTVNYSNRNKTKERVVVT
ncbi:MAG: hypothetical protein IKG56_04605, partial [Clostridia bacterium]|nr:hypothetical protein [Clostridia bacterium]